MKEYEVTEGNFTYTVKEDVCGAKHWFLNGERHRLNGPAIEWASGAKEWYIYDKKLTEEQYWKELNVKKYEVTENGITYQVNVAPDGYKVWLLNDQIHRLYGPAVEHADGTKGWFLNDIPFTKEEYWKKLNKDAPKPFKFPSEDYVFVDENLKGPFTLGATSKEHNQKLKQMKHQELMAAKALIEKFIQEELKESNEATNKEINSYIKGLPNNLLIAHPEVPQTCSTCKAKLFEQITTSNIETTKYSCGKKISWKIHDNGSKEYKVLSKCGYAYEQAHDPALNEYDEYIKKDEVDFSVLDKLCNYYNLNKTYKPPFSKDGSTIICSECETQEFDFDFAQNKKLLARLICGQTWEVNPDDKSTQLSLCQYTIEDMSNKELYEKIITLFNNDHTLVNIVCYDHKPELWFCNNHKNLDGTLSQDDFVKGSQIYLMFDYLNELFIRVDINQVINKDNLYQLLCEK